MRLYNAHPIVGLALTAFLLSPTARAESNNDRRQQLQQAANDLNNGNQQQLQPDMIMHTTQAMQHMQNAQQARQQQDYGRASQEQQMAMMEQNKAQQLQQQIQANKQAANQDQAGADALSQSPDPAQQNQRAKANTVVDLRQSDNPSQYGTQASTAQDPNNSNSPNLPVPAGELARLSDFPPPPKSASADKAGGAMDAGTPGSSNGINLGFDDSSKGGGTTPQTTSTASTGGASSAGSTSSGGGSMMGGAMGGFMGNGGMSSGGSAMSSGGGSDFWGGLGEMVDVSNKAIADNDGKLSLTKLRGRSKSKNSEKLPGAELNDEQFWSKVGREPAECKAAPENTGAKRKRQNCLHTARMNFENKWRDDHKRAKSSESNALRTAASL